MDFSLEKQFTYQALIPLAYSSHMRYILKLRLWFSDTNLNQVLVTFASSQQSTLPHRLQFYYILYVKERE